MPVPPGTLVAGAPLVPSRHFLRFPALLRLHLCRELLSFRAGLARAVSLLQHPSGTGHAGRVWAADWPGRPLLAKTKARSRARRSQPARFRRELHCAAATGQFHGVASAGIASDRGHELAADRPSGHGAGAVRVASLRKVHAWEISLRGTPAQRVRKVAQELTLALQCGIGVNMSNTRRRFFSSVSATLMAGLAACRKPMPNAKAATSVPAPGTPPAFGTAPDAGPPVSTRTFAEAEKLVQFNLSPSERETAAANWRSAMAPVYERRVGPRKFFPPSSVAPATRWEPASLAPRSDTGPDRFIRTPIAGHAPPLPTKDEDIAFATVAQLSRWIETRQLTSERLTHIYLDRLKQFDPKLHCVITLTGDLALSQAQQADREIAAGHYRGL